MKCAAVERPTDPDWATSGVYSPQAVSPPVFSRLCLCEGVPGLITADMVKEGAAVIDVGINRIQDPKTGKIRLIGDVDFDGE